ncbi:histone deacetylase family protein [Faunimonas sp. B44]|uniref:histone deacetylase family protein n=1 Tax=Faunimonas sp. B44 TaxID=3461493 RepID=UPI0040440A40
MPLAIVHHPAYDAPIPQGHRFPMGKFRRLAERIAADGLPGWRGFEEPVPIGAEALRRVHDEAYVAAVLASSVPPATEREIGLPVSEAVARRAEAATGGTLRAAELALRDGLACNSAGGSHHARQAGGAGFCVFNDVAVAVRALRAQDAIGRALIVDLDVHQGDGTAAIFARDRNVFTLSVHAERNYPVRKVPSDLDVALPDGTRDEAYVEVVRRVVPEAVEAFRPNIVFYNAGVDPHRDDRLGRLALSDEGLRERDLFVIDAVREAGVPLACVIGGGYAADLEALVGRHMTLFRAAARFA